MSLKQGCIFSHIRKIIKSVLGDCQLCPSQQLKETKQPEKYKQVLQEEIVQESELIFLIKYRPCPELS